MAVARRPISGRLSAAFRAVVVQPLNNFLLSRSVALHSVALRFVLGGVRLGCWVRIVGSYALDHVGGNDRQCPLYRILRYASNITLSAVR